MMTTIVPDIIGKSEDFPAARRRPGRRRRPKGSAAEEKLRAVELGRRGGLKSWKA